MKKLFKSESILLFLPEIIVIVVLLSYAAYSCTSKTVCVHNTPGAIMIIPSDTVEGRPTYTVLFEDEKGLDHMYGEEIGNSLATGKWDYDEDLVITTEK
jgi:hypothetical protein